MSNLFNWFKKDQPKNPPEVAEYQQNDEVDELDRLLWGPIEEFNKECEELYLVPEGE